MTVQTFTATAGQKLPHQEWQKLIGAVTDFYDNSQQHNGLNLKSSNYSGALGFEVYGVWEADVSIGATGDITTYRNFSAPFVIKDYGDEVATGKWSQAITTTDLSGNSLSLHAPINGEFIMKCVWTKNVGAMVVSPIVIFRIQDISGGNIIEYSTVRTNLEWPLIPFKAVDNTVDNEPKIVAAASTITATAIIDGAMLTKGNQYRITAKMFAAAESYTAPTNSISAIAGTGTVTFTVNYTAGFDQFFANDIITIAVRNNATEALIETFTGYYAGAAASFTSDAAAGQSVKDFLTGSFSDGLSMSFNRTAWGTATGTAGATVIRLDMTIKQFNTGLTSAIGSGVIPGV